MWWANWISLGIIVTCFACMAQRLVSSMKPTKNASAASCRHIMALSWKHRSVLPTAWAISWTSHEKGRFPDKELSALLELAGSLRRATVPGQYFLVFFTFPALRNSFWGALPPMVGQSFRLTGSSPETDGPVSTAIQANCWVGKQWQWLTHFLQPSSLLYPPLSLFHHLLHLPRGWGISGWGGVVYWRGGLLPFFAIFSWSSFVLNFSFPPPPSLVSI